MWYVTKNELDLDRAFVWDAETIYVPFKKKERWYLGFDLAKDLPAFAWQTNENGDVIQSSVFDVDFMPKERDEILKYIMDHASVEVELVVDEGSHNESDGESDSEKKD